MKTFVLLHYPSMHSDPVGVWYWNSVLNAPASYYMPGQEKYRDLAIDMVGHGKDQSHWEQWAQKMSDRVPVGLVFQADTISVSPITYLKAVRKGSM